MLVVGCASESGGISALNDDRESLEEERDLSGVTCYLGDESETGPMVSTVMEQNK